MQDFRNVDAWTEAHALTLRIYRETSTMPKDEAFGITMQLRRSATAIATRIAEGCGRQGNIEFAADLRRAIGHCSELEYLIVVARDLQYWSLELSEQLISSVIEVRKMTFGLLRVL